MPDKIHRNNAGRPKGSPNKATRNAREAIAALVDDNSARLQAWLDQIAEEDGAQAAWRCMMDVIEYHIPKLARTELTGDQGGPIQVQIVKFGGQCDEPKEPTDSPQGKD